MFRHCVHLCQHLWADSQGFDWGHEVHLTVNGDAGVALYIRVLQIPVCMLLLVQVPQRNQLCLMEFLIVWPEFESWRSYVLQVTGSGETGRGVVSVKLHFFSHSGNTGECFFNDFGDVSMLHAQQTWVEDMHSISGLVPKTVECWLCIIFYACVCHWDYLSLRCCMFYHRHIWHFVKWFCSSKQSTCAMSLGV